MIQLILILAAIGAGFYGAITGNVLALAGAMLGMLIGASGIVTPAPARQQERQERLRRWLQQYGWTVFLLLAVGVEGFTIQQLQTNEFNKSSSFYWLVGILLVIVAGIVHDRSIRTSANTSNPEKSNPEEPGPNEAELEEAVAAGNKPTTMEMAMAGESTADVDQVPVATTSTTAVAAPALTADLPTDHANDHATDAEGTTIAPTALKADATAVPNSQRAGWWAGLQQLSRSGSQRLQSAFQGHRLDWLLIVLLTAVALWMRLHKLSDFLPTMHGDEGEMGELARLALRGPESGLRPVPLPLFSTGFLDHPTLFHYLQAFALAFFGDSLSGLRTLSAVFGALCVPPLYILVKRGWGRVAAITGAWLLAVSHIHINYSRIALNNIESVFAMIVLVMLFILAAQRQQRHKPQPILLYLFAGLTMGLSQYFYYGSRLLPVIAAIYVLYLLVARRITFAQIIGLAIAALVPYMPLLYRFSMGWQSFLNRTQGVSIFNPEGMAHTLGADATWPRDIPLLFWEQLKRNISLFVASGDRSAFYLPDLPGFDPLTVVLFWLGLGVVLARSRRFQNFALSMWFAVGLLLAGILTTDAPNGPRLIVMIPVVYAIAGVPLQQLYGILQQLWPTVARGTVAVVLVVVGIGTFQANYTYFFDTYVQRVPNLMPTSMAHTIRAYSDDHIFYLYGAPNFFAEYGVLRFLTPESVRLNATLVEEAEEAIREQANRSTEETADKGIMIIALLHRLQEIDTLVSLFPGGVYEEHKSPSGQLLYASYRLSAEEIASFAVENTQSTDGAEDQATRDFLRETGALPGQLASPLPTPTSQAD
ncbi:MAG: glycosyltransferase family 39 protein [Caldilineaceae bacterium]|nr:glycosyltransferase family 39 protein [Caldilineaceae bacterium]